MLYTMRKCTSKLSCAELFHGNCHLHESTNLTPDFQLDMNDIFLVIFKVV